MTLTKGINIIEGQGVSSIEGASTVVSGIVGSFRKGPLNKNVRVNNMSEFEKVFGAVPALGTTSYYSVKGFFQAAGNAPLYVVRVAGSSAALGTVTLNDRNGTPVSTLKIDAKNQGIWGNSISVKILDANIISTKPSVSLSVADVQATLLSVEGLEVGSHVKFDNGTTSEFKELTAVDAASKTISWAGGLANAYTIANGSVVSQEFTLEVYHNGLVVETFEKMSMNDSVSFFVEKKVISNYIAVTDTKSSDTDYKDNPAVTATAQALVGGLDGLSDVVGADYSGSQATLTGAHALDGVSDLFRIFCPNPKLTDADPVAAYKQLVQDLTTYATNRKTVMYYGDIPFAQTSAQAATFVGDYTGRNVTFFWPWGSAIEKGLAVWTPPSAVVVGTAVKKDQQQGVHVNVGNLPVPYFTELETLVGDSESNTINDAGVMTLEVRPGRGIVTYGGRTRSAVTNFRFISASEFFNYVILSLQVALADVPFSPNNQQLWTSVVRRTGAFLANEQSRGALFDPNNPGGIAFKVKMDSENNPADQVALGIAKTDIEYAIVGVAEKFVLEVTSSSSGLSVG